MVNNCWDCGGSGKKDYYHQIDNGICYTCSGTGKTNKQTGEVAKAHRENKNNITEHYKVEQRITKGEKMLNDLSVAIGKKITNKEDATGEIQTHKKYMDLLTALKIEKERLEGAIVW